MDQPTDRVTATRPAAEDRGAHDGSKAPHEIEADIVRTRVRLSVALEALERELGSARIIERSAEMLRRSLEPGPGPVREQVWAYAIPLALIVTGLGWLFVLRRRSYQADMPSSFGEMPADAVEAGVDALQLAAIGLALVGTSAGLPDHPREHFRIALGQIDEADTGAHGVHRCAGDGQAGRTDPRDATAQVPNLIE